MKTSTPKKIYSFILPVMFSLFLPGTSPSKNDAVIPAKAVKKEMTINPVIGDISFVSKFGYLPDVTTDEHLRITTHFEYVENLLRSRDVSNLSPEQQCNRTHLIDLFHQYKVNGKFPKNFDYPDQRKPCFIDKENTICAVGYLVEQTAGRDVAEAINYKFKYDDVLDMHDPLVDDWVDKSGLTKEEVAMIQPTYGGGCYYCPPCDGNKMYVCRWSNCLYECKCISPNQVNHWQSSGSPCDTIGGNGNGNGNGGHGNGNGNGNWFSDVGSEPSLEVYPNPASETVARLAFDLPGDQQAVLRVFGIDGRLMGTVVNDILPEGHHEYNWYLQDITPGVYFIRLEAGMEAQTKMVMVTN